MAGILSSSLRPNSWVEQRELLAYLPFDRVELWGEVRAGRFPPPYVLGPNTIAWNWGEVLTGLGKKHDQP